jgi:preprotein translocase subunit SecE
MAAGQGEMTTQDVQTVNNKLDLVLVVLAVAVLLAGVLGFSLLSERTLLVRIGILIGGLALAAGIAWFSQSGKRFIGFARESYDETRRVSWPSRKETVNTTGIVFAFVVIMAIFLFIVDKSLEFVLYDLLLRWK